MKCGVIGIAEKISMSWVLQEGEIIVKVVDASVFENQKIN